MHKYKDVVYPRSFIYDINISDLNREELEKVINKIEGYILNSTINIKASNGDFKISTNEIISSLNKDDFKKDIINYGKNKSFTKNTKGIIFAKDKNYKFNIEINEEILNKKIENIATVSNINYKNAKVIINGDDITIQKEKSGYILDEQNLTKSINKKLDNFEKDKSIIVVDAKFKEVDAKIKSNDLKSIDKKISEFNTSYSGSSGRRINVENAAKKIDDIVLMPGDEFSYEEVIGPVTYENGYKDAPVIINGETSMDVGGGVCQVSSTMYNAQLKAGILPTERRNHSKAVAYVPRGLDATLASGIIDYKFKNTYDYPLVINTYTENSNVYIEFWSNKEATKGITYEPISFISGKSAQSYIYGYDSKGNKVYDKFIDTSMYK